MPNYTNFIAMFPEFADLNQAFVELWLAQSILKVSSNVFGEMYELATYYLLAHSLSVYKTNAANNGQDKGIVSSESIGDVSVSYAQPTFSYSNTAGNYQSTSYGREYLAIRKQKVIRMSVVNS